MSTSTSYRFDMTRAHQPGAASKDAAAEAEAVRRQRLREDATPDEREPG